ncbi:C45 family autoproteolytic acyltransferase/hydolase [Oceanibacterium hippocampi]|uniref:Acyl-coenzyme A:6-aminopenicillanic acid acyl-transferase n=1 Tax=Oceanibacterium hippocampi TaxID=745714 RepID=A0A1Y5TD76_9PROT|nr:C45 family peptidase [Oceanibacterium hippocampi]SLN61457.1 Acyl-coenzyme A:6-aminopenicillanic acid acyl-transferase [Oceanibacterium hippocampi]
MNLTFSALSDDATGAVWRQLFERSWPAYRRWYLSEGEEARPTYLACRRALATHMPEFVPVWERLCGLAGGGDLAARFLSLYRPPRYLSGCSQAVWTGATPLLVRNYDYSPFAFDGVVLRDEWMGRAVMGTSDCLVGLVDGVNDAGLAISLTFGGRSAVGDGFGVPIILRYVLQTCTTAAEAAETLTRIPTHMAYNVTVLDAERRWATVYLAPDRAPLVTRAAVATNHQERVELVHHARATATVERERFLLQRLTHHPESQASFIAAFQKPPLYSLAFDRGFGTLYTAAYWAKRRTMALCWPGQRWDLKLADFVPGTRTVSYPLVAERA